MRRPFISLLLLLALTHSKAQSSGGKDSLISSFSSFKPVIIRLGDQERSHSSARSLFRHFEVLDARPDTARIGAHAGVGLFGKGSRQLVLARNASHELGDYLDARFSAPEALYTALVVVRVLWVSDATYTLSDISKDTSVSHQKTRIRIKAEIYAERSGVYTPLFRFDSTLMSRTVSYMMTGQDLAGMLDVLADSAAIVAARKGAGGRQLSWDDIHRFNQSRFDDPVIYRDSTLVSGVYRDFQEFKDNAPSIHNFQTMKEKDNLLLYLRENGGNSYYSRNAWGYCDGKTIYVMKDGMLVPTWKEGKAFYLLGQPEEGDFTKPVSDVGPTMPIGMESVPVYGTTGGFGNAMTGTAIPGSSQGTNRKASLKHIFTVDMDTGKLY